MKGKGYFVAPLAMYNSLKKDLINHVIEGKRSLQLLKENKQGDVVIDSFTGFEVPEKIVDKETNQEYQYGQISVHSSQINAVKLKSMKERIAKSLEEINDFKDKIKYGKKYDCVERVFDKITSILKTHSCENFINFTVNEETVVNKKKIGRGRSCAISEYVYTDKKSYIVNYSMNKENIKIEEAICGYFVIATNKPKGKLSMKQTFGAYKQEWKVERIFERLKGPLQVIPILLKDPRHIEAMLYLLVTCPQVFTLIDREDKNSLAVNNERLAGLFPNKITTRILRWSKL